MEYANDRQTVGQEDEGKVGKLSVAPKSRWEIFGAYIAVCVAAILCGAFLFLGTINKVNRGGCSYVWPCITGIALFELGVSGILFAQLYLRWMFGM